MEKRCFLLGLLSVWLLACGGGDGDIDAGTTGDGGSADAWPVVDAGP